MAHLEPAKAVRGAWSRTIGQVRAEFCGLCRRRITQSGTGSQAKSDAILSRERVSAIPMLFRKWSYRNFKSRWHGRNYGARIKAANKVPPARPMKLTRSEETVA